jgi:hypothetical protein
MEASAAGNADIVKLLILANANIDMQDHVSNITMINDNDSNNDSNNENNYDN